MAAEIFSGRGVMLNPALGAMTAETLAVFTASGVWPETSMVVESVVYLGSESAFFRHDIWQSRALSHANS